MAEKLLSAIATGTYKAAAAPVRAAREALDPNIMQTLYKTGILGPIIRATVSEYQKKDKSNSSSTDVKNTVILSNLSKGINSMSQQLSSIADIMDDIKELTKNQLKVDKESFKSTERLNKKTQLQSREEKLEASKPSVSGVFGGLKDKAKDTGFGQLASGLFGFMKENPLLTALIGGAMFASSKNIQKFVEDFRKQTNIDKDVKDASDYAAKTIGGVLKSGIMNIEESIREQLSKIEMFGYQPFPKPEGSKPEERSPLTGGLAPENIAKGALGFLIGRKFFGRAGGIAGALYGGSGPVEEGGMSFGDSAIAGILGSLGITAAGAAAKYGGRKALQGAGSLGMMGLRGAGGAASWLFKNLLYPGPLSPSTTVPTGAAARAATTAAGAATTAAGATAAGKLSSIIIPTSGFTDPSRIKDGLRYSRRKEYEEYQADMESDRNRRTTREAVSQARQIKDKQQNSMKHTMRFMNRVIRKYGWRGIGTFLARRFSVGLAATLVGGPIGLIITIISLGFAFKDIIESVQDFEEGADSAGGVGGAGPSGQQVFAERNNYGIIREDRADEYARTRGAPVSSIAGQNQDNMDYENFRQRIIELESEGQNVQNLRGGSAFGIYQIDKKTFEDVKKNDARLKNISYEDFKKNTDLQTKVFDSLTGQNARFLKQNGVEADPFNLYLAHRLGAPAAVKILKEKNKDLDLIRALPIPTNMTQKDWVERVKRLNPDMAGKSINQFLSERMSAFGGRGSTMTANAFVPAQAEPERNPFDDIAVIGDLRNAIDTMNRMISGSPTFVDNSVNNSGNRTAPSGGGGGGAGTVTPYSSSKYNLKAEELSLVVRALR